MPVSTPEPRGYDAVLFDLDGTLIDTEALALRSNARVFAALGHPVDADFLHQLIGKDAPSSAAIIHAAMPDLDLAALEQALQAAFYQDIAAEGLALKPGAAALLAALTVPAALVTSSGRLGAERKLAAAGLSQAFRVVVTLDDVGAAKPAPEPYLLAAAQLGVDPSRCLVFEDSEIGAEAAYRAGCRVVQVPDLLPASGQWAHLVAPDLLEGARLAGLALKAVAAAG